MAFRDPPHFSDLRSYSSPLTYSSPVTLAFLLFLEHAKPASALGSWPWLFALPGKLFFQDVCMARSLISFRSLLKCHFISEAFLIYNYNLNLIISLLCLIFLSFITIWHDTYSPVYFLSFPLGVSSTRGRTSFCSLMFTNVFVLST